MKKSDFAIIIAVLLLAAAAFFTVSALRGGAPAAVTANVYVDGRLVSALELKPEAYEVTIEAGGGVNTLLVESDGVRVRDADCASRACVHSGKIAYAGQIIVCLPHRLTVLLEGGEGVVDAVAR